MSSLTQQKATAGSGAAGTVAATFDSSVTSGSLIAVGFTYDMGVGNANTVSSVQDTIGNLYAISDEIRDTTQGQASALWYARRVTGGSNTVTVTFSASADFRRLIIAEFLTGTDVFDQHTTKTRTATNTNTDGLTCGPITPSARALIVAFVEIHASQPTVTVAPGTNFAEVTETGINSPAMIEMEFLDIASPVSTSATWTLTADTPSNYIAAMASFVQTSGPGDDPPFGFSGRGAGW